MNGDVCDITGVARQCQVKFRYGFFIIISGKFETVAIEHLGGHFCILWSAEYGEILNILVRNLFSFLSDVHLLTDSLK